ncbi:hypothetical protein ABEB36_010782 [Hypothenemus hampei]|uniref:HTH OST-type domain-containing protein n=1 Tax=Hypothenemus hampei TaxID=57062 RepID=A0ABD1EF39_HYPHA
MTIAPGKECDILLRRRGQHKKQPYRVLRGADMLEGGSSITLSLYKINVRVFSVGEKEVRGMGASGSGGVYWVVIEVTRRVREVKVVITGILAPVPGGITLDQFLRDYRERVGMELPYRGLGFPDALSLLAAFPDVCTISTNIDVENPGPEDTWIHAVRDDQVFPIRIRIQTDHVPPEEHLVD